MKLLVGLGNPGREYTGTRHNIGFAVIDRLAEVLAIPLRRRKFDGCYGEGEWQGIRCGLCQPQTYMNRSGSTVGAFVRWYALAAEDLLVIHDELDIPLGQVKFARGRGAAGHRGVASVIEAIGSPAFHRLRVGIGRPARGEDPTAYVLAGFRREEAATVGTAIARAAEAAQVYIGEGIARAMEQFHQRRTEGL